jgi:hypothetical protein
MDKGKAFHRGKSVEGFYIYMFEELTFCGAVREILSHGLT